MEELKCPHCGSENIESDDCYDIEVTFDRERENEVVLRHINGYCEDCGALDLQWTEVYEFIGYKGVKVNE